MMTLIMVDCVKVQFQLLEQQHKVVHFSKISPDDNVELASLYKLC